MSSQYRIRVDLRAAMSAPQRCPGCGSAGLVPVAAGERADFHCRACGRTWAVELGLVRPITEGAGPRCASD